MVPPTPEPAAPVSRLAPSPTGALHLGNARTFLVNWALARRNGWRLLMRIEDLDTPRVKPGSAGATLDTLAWLGLDWDGPVRTQSADLDPYRHAMRRLARAGLVYPCALSRSQIEAAASAPQEGSGEARFPPELRPAGVGPRDFDDEQTNWRFLAPPADRGGEVAFDDAFAGPQRRIPADTIGDFIVWTARATPAYQLAVVVDDAAQGITHIVRGDDLLDSAARQLLLYRALGLAPEPSYLHLPLVRGPDGRRLAKRHGDTRLSAYRDRGVAPERLVGLCAHWCGMTADRTPMTPAEFRDRLAPGRIPRADVAFTPEDDAWLCA